MLSSHIVHIHVYIDIKGPLYIPGTISQDAPATSCATSSTFVLYAFVFIVHCSLKYTRLIDICSTMVYLTVTVFRNSIQ